MSSSAPVSAWTSAGSGEARRALCWRRVVEDVVGDAVALVLALDDLGADPVRLRVVVQQVAEELRGPVHVAPRLGEQLEQTGIGAPWHESKLRA